MKKNHTINLQSVNHLFNNKIFQSSCSFVFFFFSRRLVGWSVVKSYFAYCPCPTSRDSPAGLFLDATSHLYMRLCPSVRPPSDRAALFSRPGERPQKVASNGRVSGRVFYLKARIASQSGFSKCDLL